MPPSPPRSRVQRRVAWLAGELDGDPAQLASMTLDLLVAGSAWATGFRPDELGYTDGPPAHPPQPGQRGPAASGTGVEWMDRMTSLFGWMTPGEVRHFPLAQRDAAIAWAAA